MDDRKIIGGRVKAARIEAGLTRPALSNRLLGYGTEISEQSLLSLETGGRSLKVEELPNLAAALGVPVLALMAYDDVSKDDELAALQHLVDAFSKATRDLQSTVDHWVNTQTEARRALRNPPDSWGTDEIVHDLRGDFDDIEDAGVKAARRVTP